MPLETRGVGSLRPDMSWGENFYIECEWFGADCERTHTVEVTRQAKATEARLTIPGLTAAGCLATLPLTIEMTLKQNDAKQFAAKGLPPDLMRDWTPHIAGDYLVRYYKKVGDVRRQLVATCSVTIERQPTNWRITLHGKA